MTATWKQLTFIPSPEALRELRDNWGWLLDESLQAFMCSASGDVFFEDDAGAIHWLNTGQGALTKIEASQADFLAALRTDQGAEWLLSNVVDSLIDAGMALGPDQCYGFKVLPILGGEYSIENMVPMSAVAWYGFSGYMHYQIKDLPDGSHVRLTTTP